MYLLALAVLGFASAAPLAAPFSAPAPLRTPAARVFPAGIVQTLAPTLPPTSCALVLAYTSQHFEGGAVYRGDTELAAVTGSDPSELDAEGRPLRGHTRAFHGENWDVQVSDTRLRMLFHGKEADCEPTAFGEMRYIKCGVPCP